MVGVVIMFHVWMVCVVWYGQSSYGMYGMYGIIGMYGRYGIC